MRARYLPVLFGFAALILAIVNFSFWGIVGAIVVASAGFVFAAQLREREEIESQAEAAIDALEDQLDRQRNALAILTDGLQTAVFTCDLRPAIVHANKAAIDMFRFGEPVGRTVLAVTLSHELEEMIHRAIKLGEPQHKELTIANPKERVVIADSWLEPGGERVFLSLYEITDLRHLERVRTDFVANVSHELRTPLTTIRAMAETLQEEHADDVLRERFLGKIMSEVDRLSLIAEDLLILSSAESNPVRKQACDLGEILTSVVHQLRRKATQKGLELTYAGPNHLMIEANPSQINQVAINLIDNAINYTPEGSVNVTVDEQPEFVAFHVADSGMGIPSEHVGRIFERFYRVDKGRSRATGGTGLGLSIVKHIAEAHGGRVSVDSALNRGSTFTVELPKGDVTSQPEASN